jgi:hypothetical protein
MNIKKNAKFIIKYLCLFVILSPIRGYTDELKDEFINSYEVIFTARYVQAGKTKRYLIEDIFKGSVDKLTIDYVTATQLKDEKLNDEVILIFFRKKPSIGISIAAVSLERRVYLGLENRKGETSLDEIQSIINRQNKLPEK